MVPASRQPVERILLKLETQFGCNRVDFRGYRVAAVLDVADGGGVGGLGEFGTVPKLAG